MYYFPKATCGATNLPFHLNCPRWWWWWWSVKWTVGSKISEMMFKWCWVLCMYNYSQTTIHNTGTNFCLAGIAGTHQRPVQLEILRTLHNTYAYSVTFDNRHSDNLHRMDKLPAPIRSVQYISISEIRTTSNLWTADSMQSFHKQVVYQLLHLVYVRFRSIEMEQPCLMAFLGHSQLPCSPSLPLLSLFVSHKLLTISSSTNLLPALSDLSLTILSYDMYNV